MISYCKTLQLEFWTAFNANAVLHKDFIAEFNLVKAPAKHWIDIATGTPHCRVCLTMSPRKKEITAGLYIFGHDEIFDQIRSCESKLIEIFGEKPIWREANKDSRYLYVRPFDVTDKESWQEAFTWMCDMSLKIKESLAVLD